MFGPTVFALVAASGMLASRVSAHMILSSPVPYGKDSLDNSPLLDKGTDFPCKLRSGGYDITHMNTIAVGVPQPLTFMGGATHGGGSCQVSVSLDKEPTPDSQWKVIHSIVGGCPSNGSTNLSGDPTGTNSTAFHYTMPEGMPNGQYSLAWTWFNKFGNREMYMNCAPITVTGGANDNKAFNALPDMFVINLPWEQCKIVDNQDFIFPSPGDSVTTVFSTALGSATTGLGCAQVTIKGRGAGTAGSPAAATNPPGSVVASSAPSYGSAPPAASSPAAASGGSPAAVIVTTVVTAISTATANAAAPKAAPDSAAINNGSAVANTPSGSGSCPASQVPCSASTAFFCINSKQFGMCEPNGCALPQDMAAGTMCKDGGVVAASKRDMDSAHGHHMRKHIAGRLSF